MGNKICPFCSAEISEDAKKCKFCGEWVTEHENNKNNLPEEIRHFNWGAFLLNWIWGIMHKKYITLVYFPACLIPVIGPLAVSLWFGFAGNKWVWDSQKGESPDQFNEIQRGWVRLWLILFLAGTIITVKVVMIVFFLLAYLGSVEV